MTRQEIYEKITQVLQQTFEIAPERIVPEARLYEDLDIDSIDAVDLIVQMKSLSPRPLKPETFKSVRTVQDVVDALYGLIHDKMA